MTDSIETTFSPAAADRGERLALRVLLWLGLLLMLLAAGTASAEPTVTRTDRFSGVVKPGGTVKVDNVSGDVTAAPGKEFSGTVTVSVSAPTRERAAHVLSKTSVTGFLHDNEYTLVARWPDARFSPEGRRRRGSVRCDECRVSARIELVVPSGVAVELKTVNGEVRVQDLDGDLVLETVNGGIAVQGFRKSLSAQTVNGRIAAAAREVPAARAVELETVNGPIVLTLPKEAKFDLSASTMNGAIRSTFPLPLRGAEPDERKKGKGTARAEHPRTPRKIVVLGDEDETMIIDLAQLEREIARSMREAEMDSEEAAHEAAKEARLIHVLTPHRSYSHRVGPGGARVRIESLNGNIVLLASGTREQDARPLVSERRSIVVTVPRIELRIPKPVVRVVPDVKPVPQLHVVPDVKPVPQLHDEEEDIVRGDVPGDFLSTSGGGNYRIGQVEGRVKILTHSGEIQIGGAGAGAELKTYGGDIRTGPVSGDLKAQTLAGDIRADSVTGSASLDTSGGDIRVERVGGRLEARTAGGDIVASSVGGGVTAHTAGGNVRIALAGREAPGGAEIRSGGGDIVLTLPADFRGDMDLSVSGAEDWDDRLIRSDFPEISISRKSGSERAYGALNGGGTKVFVQTTSGTIRLRKAAPAGK